MKRISQVVFIINIVLLICAACSRHDPESSEDNTHRSYAPSSTITNHTDTAAPAISRNVSACIQGTVLDALSQYPLADIEVCAIWRVGGEVRQREVRTQNNGTFLIEDSTLTSRASRVFFRHAGYIPCTVTWTGAPLKVSLTEGDTVRVSGILHDEKGEPVSGARIFISTVNWRQWWDHHKKFTSCDAFTDDDGRFVHEAVPANMTYLCPEVHHPSFPEYEFVSNTYDTTDGDVFLELTITRGISVTGHVRLAHGGILTDATVWAENVPNNSIENWQRTITVTVHDFPRARTQSKEDGSFEIGFIPRDKTFVVKAWKSGFPVAYAGPFTFKTTPDTIDLIVNDDGPRLIGSFSNNQKQPLTNVQMYTHTLIPDGHSRRRMFKEKLLLEIEPNGNYISQPMRPGTHVLKCTSEGYKKLERKIVISPQEHSVVDFTFMPWQTITGIVVDAHTQQPLAGATIKIRKNKQLEFSDFSDSNGMFMLSEQHRSGMCTLPGYADNSFLYSTHRPLVVYMSYPCTVRVDVRRSDGTPVTYGFARLEGSSKYRYPEKLPSLNPSFLFCPKKQ